MSTTERTEAHQPASRRAAAARDERRAVGRPLRLATLRGDRREVAVVRSASELESLRDAWSARAGDNARADLDYFLWSLREEPQVVRPHVIAVETGGETHTIVAARLMDVRLPCKLGFWTVYAPRVRAISVLHGGVLGRLDAATADAVVLELQAALERGEADVVLFRELAVDSPLHRAVRARQTFATRQRAQRVDLRWQIGLPATHDAYLASLSAGTRKGIRRTAKRLEERFGTRLALRRFEAPDELDDCLADVERVAVHTYQRRMGVGYLGTAAQRARFGLLARNGWFRAYVLYLDERPVAFELGELYGGRFRSLAGAYDRAYGEHRVGSHLLLEAIADLVHDPKASIFDFGHGHADYKQKLAHVCDREADVLLYAARRRPVRINFVRGALLALADTGAAALRRLAFLHRLANRWRRGGGRTLLQAPRASARAATRPEAPAGCSRAEVP